MSGAESVECEGLVVLPAIRLNRLREAVQQITADRKQTQQVMEAIEQHVERDAYRWGNACAVDDCGLALDWNDDRRYFECRTHGAISAFDGTMLLVAFRPARFDHD